MIKSCLNPVAVELDLVRPARPGWRPIDQLGELRLDELGHRRDLLGLGRGPQLDHLAAFARRTLRERFLAADLGITGCNLAVAETGSVVLVENEGNGRLSTTVPRVHIAIMGLERIVEPDNEVEE